MSGGRETDRDEGLYRGRQIARRFVSSDGLVILVGKSAQDNDLLTFKLGRPYDFWLHVAADSGSHVVVLNPDKLKRMPRATRDEAAGLSAGYSGLRDGGNVAVRWATCADVRKPKGAPAGRVHLGSSQTVHARPLREL